MTLGKTIKTPYGDLILKIYKYNNGRIAILLYTEDGELFDDLTTNIPNFPTSTKFEAFINPSMNSLTTNDFNMRNLLRKLNIVEDSLGFITHNFGTYEYVIFNKEILQEYDSVGFNNFIE